MLMRWDDKRKRLVPLEKVAADEMLKSIPEKTKRVRHDTENLQKGDNSRPPRFSNCSGLEQLMLGTLYLKNSTATIYK